MSNRTILLSTAAAISLGTALVVVPPYFQPDATQFSFYLYVETGDGTHTLSTSPLFNLDGDLEHPINISVMSGEEQLGTIVYDIMPRSVYEFTIFTNSEIEITGVNVNVGGVEWVCHQSAGIHFSIETGLSPQYDCSDN